MPDDPEDDEKPSLASELAWEFVQRRKKGENPSEKEYTIKLPDLESLQEFEFLVGMDEFAGHSADYDATKI